MTLHDLIDFDDDLAICYQSSSLIADWRGRTFETAIKYGLAER